MFFMRLTLSTYHGVTRKKSAQGIICVIFCILSIVQFFILWFIGMHLSYDGNNKSAEFIGFFISVGLMWFECVIGETIANEILVNIYNAYRKNELDGRTIGKRLL